MRAFASRPTTGERPRSGPCGFQIRLQSCSLASRQGFGRVETQHWSLQWVRWRTSRMRAKLSYSADVAACSGGGRHVQRDQFIRYLWNS